MSDFPTEFLEVVLAEYGVTEAGLEVLLPTLKGKTAKTVADTLGISPAAVRKRISEAYQKIGISDDKPGPGKLKELKTLLSEKYNSFPKVANQLSPGMTSAPDVPVFCGRKDELNTLTHWIVNERCRLITILGMGGIGKTALAVKFVEQLKQKSKVEFEDDYIIWHSLSDGSPLKETLKKLLSFFPEVKTSDSLKEMIAFFIRDCLQKHRCLIILDNAESVIGSNQPEDGTEYEEYCEFLLQISETQSRSCIILTSREKPLKIASLEGGKRPVRSLQISGLSEEDAYNLFKTDNSSPNLDSSEVAISKIVSSYAGNPFFLKIASTTINSIFDGDVDAFMNEFVKEEAPVFGDIRELLEQQFNRLSTLEEQIMYWLAIENQFLFLLLGKI
jgi:DNA-binding CsgD family transcriptional regulator